MTHDPLLASRVRALLADEAATSERAMFGGLAFLVTGRLAVAAGGDGQLMVRVDPSRSAESVDPPSVLPVQMKGRALAGWLEVRADALREEEVLRDWVERGVARAAALPMRS